MAPGFGSGQAKKTFSISTGQRAARNARAYWVVAESKPTTLLALVASA